MAEGEGTRVAVVGAGLVGTLEACLLAKRGFTVDLYEGRRDIRTMEHVPGRSINLAMSIRGRSAMRLLGLEDSVIAQHGIPMKARMIHDPSGGTRAIPYSKDGQSIYSVGRRFVNEVLLSKADTFDNLTCHYEHKIEDIDVDKAVMKFKKLDTGEITTHSADVVIGCDGAYSAVRKKLLKQPHFNYQQKYIPHGYMELCIPPTADGDFAMPPNYLHIWPRGQFMMIALPNQDKSWTVTLFMPFNIFDSLDTREKLLEFFDVHYADSIALIGKDRLVSDFFANKALPMISVKCSPYHVGDTCLIMGDAAHAMVPFYGQGMNCGMEDCVVLDELLDENSGDLRRVLPLYSERRNPDNEAIVDLAMYNYIEMRDLVNSWSFLMRKKVDDLLNTLFPRTWVPLYSMVTFSRTPYHQCIARKQWQDRMIGNWLWALGVVVLGVGGALVAKGLSQDTSVLNSVVAKLMGAVESIKG